MIIVVDKLELLKENYVAVVYRMARTIVSLFFEFSFSIAIAGTLTADMIDAFVVIVCQVLNYTADWY